MGRKDVRGGGGVQGGGVRVEAEFGVKSGGRRGEDGAESVEEEERGSRPRCSQGTRWPAHVHSRD